MPETRRTKKKQQHAAFVYSIDYNKDCGTLKCVNSVSMRFYMQSHFVRKFEQKGTTEIDDVDVDVSRSEENEKMETECIAFVYGIRLAVCWRTNMKTIHYNSDAVRTQWRMLTSQSFSNPSKIRNKLNLLLVLFDRCAPLFLWPIRTCCTRNQTIHYEHK